MPDNTNVNNNASVVVVGRTAPVPPGQQKSEKSVPVVIASDQSTIPVAEQNKVQSEVALSLLGIPRSEVALGIFADVNTYDVNPTEWAAEPDLFSTVGVGAGTPYDGITQDMGWGLTHVPEESGALVEAPADRTAVLTSKRFFRYQPGRVSAATFGVKTTVMNVSTTDTSSTNDTEDIGSSVYNPCVRKYGIFDNFDGYYWETRNNGQGDNFCVVRRTQSLLFNNPVDFSTSGQTEDFGATNPLDLLAPRGNETPDDRAGKTTGFGGSYPSTHNSTPPGFENVKLGDLVIYRDNLMMTHAGVYDPSLLQEEQEYFFGTNSSTDELTFDISNSSNSGLGRKITDAVYDIDTGLMTVTTDGPHGFQPSKFVTLAGIAMTCRYSYTGLDGSGTLVTGRIKTYPDRTHGYNILQVPDSEPNKFVVNVGVSTVATFFNASQSATNGARVIGLSTGQYVTYDRGAATADIGGLTNQKIYRVNQIDFDGTNTVKVQLKELNEPMGSATPDPGASQTAINITGSNETADTTKHRLITPVPFVQPVANGVIHGQNTYGAVKRSGMFPYMYKEDPSNPATATEGYIDTTLASSETGTVKAQIEKLNLYYRNWVNQNVKKDFWNVYEYRVPRSRFSGDRLDNQTDNLLYSDVTAENRAGSNVTDAVGAITQDTSIWNLEFDNVTMYKVEFSWYGAVGALFLAYVPVGAGEARWVRVHHLRASNQLKGSSLGNATLPITYLVYGGGGGLNRFGYSNNDIKRKPTSFAYGSSSEHIIKYGASYYIDGGDRGTVKLFSHGTQTAETIFGSKRTLTKGSGNNQVNITNANTVNNAIDPFITFGTNVVGYTSSYYVGAKIITGNPLDQNIEVIYVDTANRKLILNNPLAAVPSNGSTISIIANRPTPLIGLKCRDFITSSTGKDVRNRTQVYPTRLSTGSEGSVIKVDLLKTPIFQTSSQVSGTLKITTANVNIGKRGKPTLISNPSNPTYLDEGTGVYGYFLARFENDNSNKIKSILGYLERRASTTATPGYYFNALESTTDNIVLISTADTVYASANNAAFLPEGNTDPKGVSVSANEPASFTLDSLSSIKVSPQLKAPIPKTGVIVASLFIPASGEEFDLSSYFDYNKEYLSFPLTNVVESLYVVGSSDKLFNASAGISTTSASITWEEQ